MPRGIPNKKRGPGRPARKGRGPSKVKLQDVAFKIDELTKVVKDLIASLRRANGKPEVIRATTVEIEDDSHEDTDVDSDTYLADDESEEEILRSISR